MSDEKLPDADRNEAPVINGMARPMNIRDEIEYRINSLREEADNLEALLGYLPPAIADNNKAMAGLSALMYRNRW